MNTRTRTRITALAVSLFAAGAALAEGPIDEPAVPKTSTLTRAQVQAELAQARADGSLQRNSFEGYLAPAATGSTLTRAEVHAQTLRAIASGELQALNSESGSFDGRAQARRAAYNAQLAQAAK